MTRPRCPVALVATAVLCLAAGAGCRPVVALFKAAPKAAQATPKPLVIPKPALPGGLPRPAGGFGAEVPPVRINPPQQLRPSVTPSISPVTVHGTLPVPTRPAALAPATRPGAELDALADAGTKQDWARVRQAADVHLAKPGLAPEVATELKAVRAHAEALESLQRAKAALDGNGPIRNALALNSLPAAVRDPVAQAKQLEELGATLTGPWVKGADGSLPGTLDALAAHADATAVSRVRVSLALKAAESGDSQAARALVGGHVPAEGLPQKLRDLKPAEPAAVPPAPPSATAGPVPLAPEASGGGRAAVDETFAAGLPKVKADVEAATARARTRAAEVTAESIQVHARDIQHGLHRLAEEARKQADRSRDDDRTDPDAAVAAALGRPLAPAEAELVRRMRAKGKSTDECVAAVRNLNLPN
jgi:hypothetical protein